MEPCRFEKVIDMMQQDIRDIKKDVKSLLRFKFEIMTGAAIIGTILAFVVNKLWR